ncbi:hypothetical protein WN51_05488 [Melipona quadrifasciata]|uniref:Uncharacterized protein n=1 Tax=Melipona quadrifasciata TaxID=166423 RepID=A0A0M9ACS5_9HYME|nr:hypothetical protein WN51_05488 [Melipona quadrifasciata]
MFQTFCFNLICDGSSLAADVLNETVKYLKTLDAAGKERSVLYAVQLHLINNEQCSVVSPSRSNDKLIKVVIPQTHYSSAKVFEFYKTTLTFPAARQVRIKEIPNDQIPILTSAGKLAKNQFSKIAHYVAVEKDARFLEIINGQRKANGRVMDLSNICSQIKFHSSLFITEIALISYMDYQRLGTKSYNLLRKLDFKVEEAKEKRNKNQSIQLEQPPLNLNLMVKEIFYDHLKTAQVLMKLFQECKLRESPCMSSPTAIGQAFLRKELSLSKKNNQQVTKTMLRTVKITQPRYEHKVSPQRGEWYGPKKPAWPGIASTTLLGRHERHFPCTWHDVDDRSKAAQHVITFMYSVQGKRKEWFKRSKYIPVVLVNPARSAGKCEGKWTVAQGKQCVAAQPGTMDNASLMLDGGNPENRKPKTSGATLMQRKLAIVRDKFFTLTSGPFSEMNRTSRAVLQYNVEYSRTFKHNGCSSKGGSTVVKLLNVQLSLSTYVVLQREKNDRRDHFRHFYVRGSDKVRPIFIIV